LIKAQGDALAWTCPTCGNENAIEAQACAACGTPFATLFAESEARPATEPGRAQALSLLFPGLGHAAAGRGAEGLARAVAFLWLAGSAVAILVIRRGLGLGPFLPLVLLLLSAAVVLYAFTAVDARRAAEGRPPMLTTRMLMYGVTGMILLTVLVLVVTGIRASRG
jgi:hypothetical protein